MSNNRRVRIIAGGLRVGKHMHQGRARERLCECPGYRIIEQGIYVVGGVILIALLFALPSLQRARDDAAARLERRLASENMSYCEKWGMAAGTAAGLACIRDLIRIREETEQRVRDQLADGL